LLLIVFLTDLGAKIEEIKEKIGDKAEQMKQSSQERSRDTRK